MATGAPPHGIRHVVRDAHGHMRGSITLAYGSLSRRPGQHLPGGTSHICPISSLGSIQVCIQWSGEWVDAWAVVATRGVLVRIAAPV